MAVAQATETAPLLEGVALGKEYPGTRALDGVDIRIDAAEVQALLGENGAGKSTLVHILSGVLQPDAGGLRIDGEEVVFQGPQDARAAGIAVVHQELSLVPSLTVAENMALADPPRHRRLAARAIRALDRREMQRRARESLARLSLDIDVTARTEELSPARRQLVEIAKSLTHSARILLLDEPTSSLSPRERDELFALVRELRRQRVGVVFITHMLEEAIALSDRITVLRDGRKVATVAAADTSPRALVESMTGHAAGAVFPAATTPTGGTVRLEVRHLRSGRAVQDVSVAVNAGEIVGLAGVVGAGRTETLQAVVGLRPTDAGTVSVDGCTVRPRSPHEALQIGLVLVPEDRKIDGLFNGHTVAQNLSAAAANTGRGTRVGSLDGRVVSRRALARLAQGFVERLRIKAAGLDSPIETLSGGNQQKVVLGRLLATDPGVILADDPTRGVSIGSKIELYRLLREAAGRGVAIVVASSEFDELTGLCDRIVVLHQGRSVGEVRPPMSSDELLAAVLGSTGEPRERLD